LIRTICGYNATVSIPARAAGLIRFVRNPEFVSQKWNRIGTDLSFFFQKAG
jgi:hypothetical protein